MWLVRLKQAAQITLPIELRKRFHLEEGDCLEAEAVEDGILLKPVSVMDREDTRRELRALLDRVHAKLPLARKRRESRKRTLHASSKNCAEKMPLRVVLDSTVLVSAFLTPGGAAGACAAGGEGRFFLRVTFYGRKEFEMRDVDGHILWFGQITDGPLTIIVPGA